MISLEKPSLDELTHIGVKGMKWGHHKRQDSESIQNAKKHITETKEILKKEKQKMNKETLYGSTAASIETLKKVESAKNENKYAKQDLSSIKILDHFKNKEKSKAQLKTEEKYKKQGMTDDEATVAAYQNIKTKKILMAVGATTLAVAAGYAAYKIHDSRADKIIKSGTLLQNISSDSTAGIRDAFYSSNNKLDNAKYAGLYGDELKKSGGVFKKEIKVLSDIKQASPKNAQDTLSNLMKSDKDFADGLKNQMTKSKSLLGDTYALKTTKAEASLTKGVLDKNVYEVFNASLVDHSPEMQKLTDRYFNELSKKGYNAIKDVNDSKYSGFKSFNPIIAFNSTGKVDVVDIKQLTNDQIKKAKNIGNAHIATTELAKEGAIMTAAFMSAKGAMNMIESKNRNSMVDKYRQSNPKTKMTNTEIARMLERSKLNAD